MWLQALEVGAIALILLVLCEISDAYDLGDSGQGVQPRAVLKKTNVG